MAKDRYRGTVYYLPTRGKRLDDLLYERNMSVSALANQLGIDRKSIYGYMHGESDLKLSTMIRIADYFGVSIDWLVKG